MIFVFDSDFEKIPMGWVGQKFQEFQFNTRILNVWQKGTELLSLSQPDLPAWFQFHIKSNLDNFAGSWMIDGVKGAKERRPTLVSHVSAFALFSHSPITNSFSSSSSLHLSLICQTFAGTPWFSMLPTRGKRVKLISIKLSPTMVSGRHPTYFALDQQDFQRYLQNLPIPSLSRLSI